MNATATQDLKLYRVTVEYDFLVAARSKGEATDLAHSYAADAYEDEVRWPKIDLIRRRGDLSADEAESLPYSNDVDELTAAEIMEGAVKLDESNGPVHWCAGCGRERVAFDWTKEHQLCRRCEAEEVAA